MDIVKNLTKNKKDEIRKIVKELMASDNQSYDDWLFENELNYLLNNLNNLEKKKTGGFRE